MKQTILKKIKPGDTARNTLIINEAADILKRGGIIAFPTETVYGLGALYDCPDAVEAVYAAKGRPFDNPLIAHISNMEMLSAISADIPDTAFKLADAFWPGPLTIVLKKNPALADNITRGLDTIAVRMPSNETARRLIDRAGIIAAPSANTSGKPSATLPEHVICDLSGKVDMIIDGGPCEVGLESTIIDLTADKPSILRPGRITPRMLRPVIGVCAYPQQGCDTAPKVPGMKYRHYAPAASVTVVTGEPRSAAAKIRALAAENSAAKAGILATNETLALYTGTNALIISAGSRKNPALLARNLFKTLRQFDLLGCERIYAEGLPGSGIALAVMNRLNKAADEIIAL